jgi:hypothetical protein
MKLCSLVFCILLFVSCHNSSSSETFRETSTIDFALAMPPMDNESVSQNIQEQKIIKTGNIAFETQELKQTHQKILALSKQYGGIVQTDNSGHNYNRIFQQMTIRVPSNNFQAVIDGISDGVAYFDKREISQRDVTEGFVDIEARLIAKRELEKRYLALLKKAKNVTEILEIERELSAIREEIEAKQGRLKYLAS